MLSSVSGERFVALDVHKHSVVVGAVNSSQQVVLSPRRVDLDDFLSWSQQHLCLTDAVVLEATTNAWHLCDQLYPLVSSVTVAHPNLVKLITTARVKTDARDTLHLARLLAAGLIPAVWIPPQDVRELRGIVAHRARLIRQRTQAKNRLRSTLHRYNIVPPAAGLFLQAQRTWWENLSLSAVEMLRIRQDLSLLESLEPLIVEVDAELTRLSGTEPWASQIVFLLQVPGIGIINALVLLAAIGDSTRFLKSRNSSWDMLAWEPVSTLAGKPTKPAILPSKDERKCGQRSSKQPGWLSSTIPTGRSSLSDWQCGSASGKLSWPLAARVLSTSSGTPG